jgi:alpha-L-rhamnosidase
MNDKLFLSSIFACCLSFLPYFVIAQPNISTAKPWAYWWWMGNAVNEADITKNLEDFRQAGFGGLHIIPIYGVKGEEAKFIPYLSPKWWKMLDFTTQEATRLRLGIDMTLGSGWPFGGAHVGEADAAKAFKINPIQGKSIRELTIFSTKQKVKRAAPGGEGWVLDHFNPNATDRYLQPYITAFSQKNYKIRAFYNDSYEVYGANWTPNFFQQFQQKRGYDLSPYLDILAKDTASTDKERRIWADYHETLSDILLDDFTKKWVGAAHRFGKITRNEAHGAPANLLDIYAACDIPESEFFGSKHYDIPLYRQDEDYEIKRFGKPGGIVLKLASSAANVTGKKLVSSETATWLGNHFKVALSQIKPIIDESFLGGINHIFFHGIPYSPPAEPFPGWLFYASTNFNQQSHFWEHLPQLNDYITRCQMRLQQATPDNDVLLYYPMPDTWHSVGKKDKMHSIDVHTILMEKGLLNSPFGKITQDLTQNGYTYDFISDKQLAHTTIQGKNIVAAIDSFQRNGSKYRAIIVPPVDYMPLATLQQLEKIQKAGISVIFVGKTPRFVNGFFEFEKRQVAFNKILNQLKPKVTNDFLANLASQKIRKETLEADGLQFIRKKTKQSTLYFIVNMGKKYQNTPIQLACTGKSVALFNPLRGLTHWVMPEKITPSSIEIPLHLAAGESIFVEVLDKLSDVKAQKPTVKSKITHLKGTWQVDFLKGQPFLPKNFQTDTLQSWTELGDTSAQYFSGKASYTLHFSFPSTKITHSALLDLGDVRESAEVRLNEKSLGTAWCLPMQLPIPSGVLQSENILEIEVTNVSANRIRYMDKKGVAWKHFYDINMVDIRYTPFDASNWKPVASGLLGDVKLFWE